MLIKILAGCLLALGGVFLLSFLSTRFAVISHGLPPGWDVSHPGWGFFGMPGWFFDTLGVILLVTLFGLLLNGGYWIHVHLEDRRGRARAAPANDEVGRRLDEVEARTRDVLDVMIALSEKMDRWEREGPPAARDRTPTATGGGKC